MFYWFIYLKMNVDYKTILICGQPILDSMVPYLFSGRDKSIDIDIIFLYYPRQNSPC